MLLTLQQAKLHLRVTDENRNADILLKLAQAEAIVLSYLARTLDTTWTATIATWGTTVGSPGTVIAAPAVVQAAILEQLAELDAFRGDDPDAPKYGDDLSPSIQSKLRRLRLPVLA